LSILDCLECVPILYTELAFAIARSQYDVR
jgi:hypothetical protein